MFSKITKCIAVTALFFGMAQMANAQAGAEFLIPKSNKFVQITTENINVRRLPNTTSGKIMTWSSDAGSYETYEKIFYSDTEAARFRPNKRTGAFVSAYHPQQGEWMPLANTSQNPQNGWYKVIACSTEYAGNPGLSNAKLGWIKADFCKPLEIKTDGSVKNVKFPVWIDEDPETGEKKYGTNVSPDEDVAKRNFGKFCDTEFHIIRDEENNQILLAVATVEENYLLVARYCIQVVQDEGMSASYAIEEQEDDMGDNTYPVIKVKSSQDMTKTAVKALLNCPDEEFYIVINAMFPGNQFPTDEVYVVTKDGKPACISYRANDLGQEFKLCKMCY